MIEKYREILQVAEIAAREAGVKIREAIASPTPPIERMKGERDPVTETDIWVEQRLIEIISNRYPDHLLVGEETSDRLTQSSGRPLSDIISESEFAWIIDPIDGTVNFANRIPQCAISIGVLHRGKRVVALVYEPYHGELFTAILGLGATRNGEPIQVSARHKLGDSLVGTGFPYLRAEYLSKRMPLLQRMLTSFRDIRRMGAASIDLCWVACGRLDAYFEFGLKPWDVAAGSLIVEEAGGYIFNYEPQISSEFSIYSHSFAAVNKTLYQDFVALLSD